MSILDNEKVKLARECAFQYFQKCYEKPAREAEIHYYEILKIISPILLEGGIDDYYQQNALTFSFLEEYIIETNRHYHEIVNFRGIHKDIADLQARIDNEKCGNEVSLDEVSFYEHDDSSMDFIDYDYKIYFDEETFYEYEDETLAFLTFINNIIRMERNQEIWDRCFIYCLGGFIECLHYNMIFLKKLWNLDDIVGIVKYYIQQYNDPKYKEFYGKHEINEKLYEIGFHNQQIESIMSLPISRAKSARK